MRFVFEIFENETPMGDDTSMATKKRCVELVKRLHEHALKGEGDMALILNSAGDRCYAHKAVLRAAAEFYKCDSSKDFLKADTSALRRDGETCEYTVRRQTACRSDNHGSIHEI